MERLYHLVGPASWNGDDPEPYRADSLATEGFIHCSFRRQVAWVANTFYADTPDLLVLEIDPGRLTSPVKVEGVGNDGFPHVYGPIDRAAVVNVEPLPRGPDGRWTFA